jgi:hypothetical protein
MTAPVELDMQNVIGREVKVRNWSEVISNRIFSEITRPAETRIPEGVTTDLQFQTGIHDPFVAAAA